MLLTNNTITLRALEPEDLDALYHWENDTSLWQCGSTLTPYSKYVLRDYIANSGQDLFQTRQLRLMAVLTADDTCVGTVDLYDFDPVNRRAGVGILVDAAFRHQGYGRQMLRLLADYAFRFLHLKQLYAHIPQPNRASYELFGKSGYVDAGFLRDWVKTEQGFADVFVMQLFNTSETNE